MRSLDSVLDSALASYLDSVLAASALASPTSGLLSTTFDSSFFWHSSILSISDSFLIVVWVGMLPGMRESRRIECDYMLNEADVMSNRRFSDVVAYGGWDVDNHIPGGLKAFPLTSTNPSDFIAPPLVV